MKPEASSLRRPIDKTLARMIRKEREDIFSVRNETSDIMADSTSIRKTVGKYREKLCINKLDIFNEIDFLKYIRYLSSLKRK